MVNLLYVCVQYVLHIPSWGSQVHCLHQKSPTSIPPPGNRALDHIMDIQCFISRSFFGLSREKGVSFESLWIPFSLLVSSRLFLFTNAAHSRISPGFLWVILVICLLLCVASHISLFISPWIRFFWKTFCIFFFFTFFPKYAYPMGSWCQALATHHFFIRTTTSTARRCSRLNFPIRLDVHWCLHCFIAGLSCAKSPLLCSLGNLVVDGLQILQVMAREVKLCYLGITLGLVLWRAP